MIIKIIDWYCKIMFQHNDLISWFDSLSHKDKMRLFNFHSNTIKEKELALKFTK